ncbi:MAG: BspA family leucine-rich repeat surface protein, partial [Methylococcales symbiont of Iophon sp. n. MRB-2018]
FSASVFNQDIGGWNVARVTNMSLMFTNADAFNQNLGRWYVDETVDNDQGMLQTANPDYNGVDDLNVLYFNFVAQNAVLIAQIPIYTLATDAAAESSDNAIFTLESNTLSINSDSVADGSYTVRIAVGNTTFGSSNSIDLTVVVDTPLTVTSVGSFITEWRIPSDEFTLTFPSEGDYTIDWGDGTTEGITSNNPTHTYETAGDYTVTATNTITRFHLDNNAENREKLIDIQQWGIANWTSMERAFFGASAMTISASDSPNLAEVTNMSLMFSGASVFNQDIGSWNVANVSNMGNLFFGATAFNQDIGSWNVAGVMDMSSMFNNATVFNQDIGSWNVARVMDISSMFSNANVFNQNIGSWNVASVTNMNNMFRSASAFNQDIGSWNVASVTDMSLMFFGASAFNQDIGGWNVASVTNMNLMFISANAFNQNLGRWYVDETVDNLQTANADYDGVDNLNVLDFNFVAQNTVLSGHNPIYTLATDTAAEGSDNAIFTLESNTLSINSDSVVDGSYTVRIAIDGVSSGVFGGPAFFGSSNSIELTVVVGTAASLSALTLSTGTLTPVFSSDTTDYTVSVANAVTSLSVTPTVSDSSANFVISGTAADTNPLTVVNNEVSGLTEGDNTISIAVTAQDTVRTYTVTVTRLSLPGTPRNLVIDETRTTFNSITFSWQPPEANADISGYRIERAADVSGSPGVFTELVA